MASLREQLSLESVSYRFTKSTFESCHPSAPKRITHEDGTVTGIDLWLDWRGRLFYIKKKDEYGYIVTYLKR